MGIRRGGAGLWLHSLLQSGSSARVGLDDLCPRQEAVEEHDDDEHDDEDGDHCDHHHPPHVGHKVQGSPEKLRVEEQIGQSQQGPLLVHQGAVVEKVAVTSEVGTGTTHLDEATHLVREHVANGGVGGQFHGGDAAVSQHTTHVA